MEAMVLLGTKMKCPKCEGTDNLYRPEVMPILTPIRVEEDGSWDWADEMHSTWPDYQTERDPDVEAEWYCRNCMVHFDAPNVKNISEEDDAEETSETSVESNPS